jgi:DNA-binding IclR family transcriptional regulator
MAVEMANPDKLIGSVQRAINILNLFSENEFELGTSDIARRLELPKSTAAGLIATLEHNNYLDQNPDNRKYRLGFKLAERAQTLLTSYNLRQIAYPFIVDLQKNTGESVNLGVRDDTEIVYIERLHGSKMLSMRPEIGKREHIHSTALGKAILSVLPLKDISNFITNYQFSQQTPFTITEPADFLIEIERTRQRGFAIDDQENEMGGRCVAAPILDFKGQPVAAVSVSVPLQRLPDEKMAEYGDLVNRIAKQISRKLGVA